MIIQIMYFRTWWRQMTCSISWQQSLPLCLWVSRVWCPLQKLNESFLFIFQSNETGGSTQMELEGAKRCFHFLQNSGATILWTAFHFPLTGKYLHVFISMKMFIVRSRQAEMGKNWHGFGGQNWRQVKRLWRRSLFHQHMVGIFWHPGLDRNYSMIPFAPQVLFAV